MYSFSRHASSSARVRKPEHGATLAELLVVLVIVSTLAVTALPFAEKAVQRDRERDLKQALRDTRRALDAFHRDWQAGILSPDNGDSSEAGWPLTLAILVEGTKPAGGGPKRRYLRRVPQNPFGSKDGPGWVFVGYADEPGAATWNGEDVFDLRPATDKVALDGTQISNW